MIISIRLYQLAYVVILDFDLTAILFNYHFTRVTIVTHVTKKKSLNFRPLKFTYLKHSELSEYFKWQ